MIKFQMEKSIMLFIKDFKKIKIQRLFFFL